MKLSLILVIVCMLGAGNTYYVRRLEPRSNTLSTILQSTKDLVKETFVDPAKCALSPFTFPECTWNAVKHPLTPWNWIDENTKQKMNDMKRPVAYYVERPKRVQSQIYKRLLYPGKYERKR